MFAKPSLSLLSVMHLNVFCYEQSHREQKPPKVQFQHFSPSPKEWRNWWGFFLLGMVTMKWPVFSIGCDDFLKTYFKENVFFCCCCCHCLFSGNCVFKKHLPHESPFLLFIKKNVSQPKSHLHRMGTSGDNWATFAGVLTPGEQGEIKWDLQIYHLTLYRALSDMNPAHKGTAFQNMTFFT